MSTTSQATGWGVGRDNMSTTSQATGWRVGEDNMSTTSQATGWEVRGGSKSMSSQIPNGVGTGTEIPDGVGIGTEIPGVGMGTEMFRHKTSLTVAMCARFMDINMEWEGIQSFAKLEPWSQIVHAKRYRTLAESLDIRGQMR